jgi:alpha-mannosidase
MAQLRDLVERLQQKKKELSRYRTELKWKFYQGRATKAYRAEFNDSRWKSVTLPILIDARKGDAWLRCKIIVPDKIGGIEVSGSSAKVSSTIILAGSKMFVNSKCILENDYWTELRRPKVLLSKSVRPRDEYVIAIRILPYHEPVQVPVLISPQYDESSPFALTYSRVERAIFEIDCFIQELRFVNSLREDITRLVVDQFNFGSLATAKDLLEEIEKARTILSRASDAAKQFKVHLVGHGHLDLNWLWPWKETSNAIRDTFSTMISLMARNPDLHFSQSQAFTYRLAEKSFPSLFETIKRDVKAGSWEVTASTWVEGDLFMGGTEALVRQILYGKRYAKENLGVEIEIGWEPDTFGHPSTYPQLLAKSGIKYYYFMRGGKGDPLFWWEGPDGSRVLAFSSEYFNPVSPRGIVETSRSIYEKYGLKTSMFVYGVGDHGGGPTIEDVEAAHEIQRKTGLPTIKFSSAQAFFQEIDAKVAGMPIPVVKGELNPHFDGCYTTHSDMKRSNRICERLLVDAEKLGVMSGLYSKEEIEKGWLNTLFNQFHDILCGSGTHESYIYPSELAQEATRIARVAMRSSMKRITEGIHFSRAGIPIVVFNLLSWERVDLAKVQVPIGLIPKNPFAVSTRGEKVPVQLVDNEVVFVAKVPSMGYETYYLMEGAEKTGNPAGTGVLENEYLKVALDSRSGTLNSIYDKLSDRYVFGESAMDHMPSDLHLRKPEPSNLLQVLYETPHPVSAWVLGEVNRTENLLRDAKVKQTENGPVRSSVVVEHAYRNSSISQQISVYREIPRVDFSTIIVWNEVADEKTEAPMLKVSFTPQLGRAKFVSEVPFGHIERVSNGEEVPALRWIDLSDDEYGVSLLNDSRYGFDVKGNTMRMTILRTSYSPDPSPDRGRHEVLYSIYPHKGDWKQAQTFRRGYEVNHPLECIAVAERRREGSMRDSKSYVEIDSENVVLSCLKMAEESNETVVRVYDATGEGGRAEISFDFKIKEAAEMDLVERRVDGLKAQGERKILVKLKPFEVKTLWVRAE